MHQAAVAAAARAWCRQTCQKSGIKSDYDLCAASVGSYEFRSYLRRCEGVLRGRAGRANVVNQASRQGAKRSHGGCAATFSGHQALPTRRQVVVQPQQVQCARHAVLHDVFNAAGPLSEGGHGLAIRAWRTAWGGRQTVRRAQWRVRLRCLAACARRQQPAGLRPAARGWRARALLAMGG